MINIDYKFFVESTDSAEDIFKKILSSRGYKNIKAQQNFLQPPTPTLLYLIKELKIKESHLSKTADLIRKHISNNTPICIYGDYDADGVTSTAILWKTLSYLGAKVMPFIPDRKKHGYGMSLLSLDEIISGKAFKNTPMHPFIPSLIITVDNGIVAHKEVDYLKKNNIDIAITDHHQKEDKLPTADAVVHSTGTSGAGIAWLLSLYLTGENTFSFDLIDLATIGIVADQMSLTGVNRSIVSHGLKKLTNTSNPGLKELFSISGIADKAINTYDINFIIAPRINAMGRLDHALEALRLLCASNKAQIKELASIIESTNQKRQDITYQALLQTSDLPKTSNLIIASSPEFHEGVIGLIAGKLMEETYKPSIAISIGKTISKGSARSVKGVNITDLLRKVKNLLISIGGHEMASGFSLKTENLDVFIKKITEIANVFIDTKSLIPTTSVDTKLALSQNTAKLYHLIQTMEPFGLGNPKPKFYTDDFSVIESRKMGSDSQHAKLTIKQGTKSSELVWFNFDKRKNLNKINEAIYSLDLNVWNQRESIQLLAKQCN